MEKKQIRRCRCTASLNALGMCPWKCPPVVKQRVEGKTRAKRGARPEAESEAR